MARAASGGARSIERLFGSRKALIVSAGAVHAAAPAGRGSRVVVGLRVRGPGAALLARAPAAHRPLATLAVGHPARLAEQDA